MKLRRWAAGRLGGWDARRLRRVLQYLLVIVSVMGAVCPGAHALKSLGPGDPIEPVTVVDQTMAAHPLSELLGPRGALLVFWASWNPRSREILSYLSDLDRKYREEGLRVLPLNAEHEGLDRAQVDELARTYEGWGLPWHPYFFDARLDAFSALGIITFPTSVYVSRDLRVVDSYPGFPAEARDAIPELIEKGLGIWRPPVEPRRAEAVPYAPKNGAGQRFQLGRLLFARGQRRKAAEELRDAAAKDPDYALAAAAAAYAAQVAGTTPGPDELLGSLRARASEDPAFREALGVGLLAVGRFDGAREALEPLLGQEEPRVRGLVGLAYLKLRAGDAAAAAQVLARLKAWPMGGVPLALDVTPYVDDGRSLEEQWKDPARISERLLGLAGPEPKVTPDARQSR